jgi:putative DNA primase/helicase
MTPSQRPTTSGHVALSVIDGGNGSAPDSAPDEFKWIPRRGAEELRATGPYAVGGEHLWIYRDGCYRPRGEELLRGEVAKALGDNWRRARVDDVVTFIRDTAPRLEVEPPLDVINVRNGLLELSTRTLDEHTPDYLFPVQLAVDHDPEATCPKIDKFLSETLEPGLIRLLIEAVAYLITPDNSMQKAFMFVGPGGSGKSVTLNILRALLGPENVSSVALHQIEDDRFATADLYGRLANIFADLDARALKSSSIFKSITGGDTIRGERKHRPAFDFLPTARLLFSANEVPPTSDSSDAFFSRWTIVPYKHTFRGTDRCDPDLTEKLTTPSELSGLLNHALAALPALRERGRFTSAPASEEAAERFRIDADSVAGFLSECCDLGPDRRAPRAQVYRAYKIWCTDANRQPLSRQRANRRIRELYRERVTESTIDGYDYWNGLSLRKLAE